MAQRTCSINGCSRPAHCRSWCSAHYARWLRTGYPVPATAEQRFWEKVDKTDSCWLWTGAKNAKGYGTFRATWTRSAGAHRAAYELLVGPIPKGMQLDHLCRVRNCVNPAHLEPVTPGENTRRGETGKKSGALQRAKTHCPQGHPYDQANTYVRASGRRQCRACDRVRHRVKTDGV